MKTAKLGLFTIVATLAFVGGLAMDVSASDHHNVTELEAQQAYDKAAKEFQKTVDEAQNKTRFTTTKADVEASTASVNDKNTSATHDKTSLNDGKESKAVDVSMMSFEASQMQNDMPLDGLEPISDIRLAVDLERKTLKEIVNAIVEQARPMAGHWDVKWRIAEENEYILNERVNLTAETTFEQFMDYLTDRVNNMTGIELFVSVFETSRIIIISDTYY